MGLVSSEFIVFLIAVVTIYHIVPTVYRIFFLLLINVSFCATLGLDCIFVVTIEFLIAFLGARSLGKEHHNSKKRARKTAIYISVLLTILVGSKALSITHESFVAPLGVSFYTLQAISYIIDVKRGTIAAEKNTIKLFAYLSFFPTVTSGPIFRYKDFSRINPQNEKLEYDTMIKGILYVLYGYFLKSVVAGRCGIAVDTVFADFKEAQYGGCVLIIVAIMYSLQIYTDFAGYSSIVIGIAQLLGFTISENFKAPYLSMNIKEFWSRWHISLSSWLKDYVYIPLGGNRKGRIRKYLNISITFIVSGIWHGVNGIHYIIWGGIHALYQIVGDITHVLRSKVAVCVGIVEGSFFHRMIKRIVTFLLVTIAWIFFRTGVKDAVLYLIRIFTFPGFGDIETGRLLSLGLSSMDYVVLLISLIIVCVFDVVLYQRNLRFDETVSSQGVLARCITAVFLSLTILIFGMYGDQHDAGYFIYRDF